MMVLLSAPEDEDGDDDDDDDDDDDGVDFTDVTLVYKDANQHKAHKIILSWPEACWWKTAKILGGSIVGHSFLVQLTLKKLIQKKTQVPWR